MLYLIIYFVGMIPFFLLNLGWFQDMEGRYPKGSGEWTGMVIALVIWPVLLVTRIAVKLLR